jgi:hypothetical protein
MLVKIGFGFRSRETFLAPAITVALAATLSGVGCHAPQPRAEDEASAEAGAEPNAPGDSAATTPSTPEETETTGLAAPSASPQSAPARERETNAGSVKAPVAPVPTPSPDAPAKNGTPGGEAPATRPTPAPPPVPKIVEVEVPSGTVLELELLTPIDSAVNRKGDELQAKTLSALFVDGTEILGAGAYVEGRVTEATASGRVKGRARLAFTFDRLRTSTGIVKIHTSFVEKEAESGKKKDAAVIGGAAGVGAIVGGIIGGKKGAAIGATVGGAGGTGVVLTTKGEEIRLPAGSQINVRLDQPVVIQRD